MAPGPIFLGDNRYAPLLDIPDKSPNPRKKKRNAINIMEDFPELPSPSTKLDPKYLTVAAADGTKPLTNFSCFAIHRSLMLISKEIQSISSLRDGSLLLLVKNNDTANKFLKTKELYGLCPIKCSLHEKLNITKGTVYAPYLNNVPDDEIVRELSLQGVVSIYKFSRTIEGQKQYTGVILLDFNLYTLPSKIDISWHSVRVKEYLPNPMRCKSCQLLGHTLKWCKNNPSCGTCNLPPHSPAECTRTMCANCHEQHPSSSPLCKAFKMQKEILAIKTRKKCTIGQAKQAYRSLYPANITTNTNTYASTLSNPTSSNNTNITETPVLNSNTNIKNNMHSLSTAATAKTNKYETSKKTVTLTNVPSNEQNYKKNHSTKATINNTPHHSLTVNSSYDINENNINTNINSTKNTNNNFNNSNNTSSFENPKTNNNNNTNDSNNSINILSQNDNEISHYSKSTLNLITNSYERSPSPTSTANCSLYSPLPSLTKVLSSQNLNITDEETST